jgi:hypothetical protein
MKTTKLCISITLVLLVLAMAGYSAVGDFFSIDQCLDSGGAWDYKQQLCLD